jgi:hypothetical protein
MDCDEPHLRRMKKHSPSNGQNGQLVYWWLLVHSSQQWGLSNLVMFFSFKDKKELLEIIYSFKDKKELVEVIYCKQLVDALLHRIFLQQRSGSQGLYPTPIDRT